MSILRANDVTTPTSSSSDSSRSSSPVRPGGPPKIAAVDALQTKQPSDLDLSRHTSDSPQGPLPLSPQEVDAKPTKSTSQPRDLPFFLTTSPRKIISAGAALTGITVACGMGAATLAFAPAVACAVGAAVGGALLLYGSYEYVRFASQIALSHLDGGDGRALLRALPAGERKAIADLVMVAHRDEDVRDDIVETLLDASEQQRSNCADLYKRVGASKMSLQWAEWAEPAHVELLRALISTDNLDSAQKLVELVYERSRGGPLFRNRLMEPVAQEALLTLSTMLFEVFTDAHGKPLTVAQVVKGLEFLRSADGNIVSVFDQKDWGKLLRLLGTSEAIREHIDLVRYLGKQLNDERKTYLLEQLLATEEASRAKLIDEKLDGTLRKVRVDWSYIS